MEEHFAQRARCMDDGILPSERVGWRIVLPSEPVGRARRMEECFAQRARWMDDGILPSKRAGWRIALSSKPAGWMDGCFTQRARWMEDHEKYIYPKTNDLEQRQKRTICIYTQSKN